MEAMEDRFVIDASVLFYANIPVSPSVLTVEPVQGKKEPGARSGIEICRKSCHRPYKVELKSHGK